MNNIDKAISELNDSEKSAISDCIIKIANSLSDTKHLSDTEERMLTFFRLLDDKAQRLYLYHIAGYITGLGLMTPEDAFDVLEINKKD